MPGLPAMTNEQDRAVRDAIADYAGSPIVTRYVVIAETVDPDSGEPQLGSFGSPDLSPWDAIGMVRCMAAAGEAQFAGTWNSED